jgi:hypothetical protein
VNVKTLSFVAATAIGAGAIGGALGFHAASAAMSFPTATYKAVNSTLHSYVITPADLKAIRVTGENLDYWFVDEDTGKEAVVRIPVRVMVGTIKK